MEILTIILNSKAITTLVELAITFIAGYVAKKVKTFLNTKTKKDVAQDIVLAVEQIYKDLKGKDKMSKAMDMFANALASKGIKTSVSEMEYLLESAVGAFNNVFDREDDDDTEE